MTQHSLPAPHVLAERSKDTVLLKRPIVAHMHWEGGGVLCLGPISIAAHIEEKIETPLALAVPVIEAVSGSSITAVGIAMRDPENPEKPLNTCRDVAKRFEKGCPVVMPPRPNRLTKLFAASAINMVNRIINPEKIKADGIFIRSINQHCDMLMATVPSDKIQLVQNLRKKATELWLNRNDAAHALKLCAKLSTEEISDGKKIRTYFPTEETIALSEKISSLVSRRSTSKNHRLTTAFLHAAVIGMDKIKQWKLHNEDKLYDPEVRKRVFRESVGDVKLSDLINTIYIPSFDVRQQNSISMRARKHDPFDLRPDASQSIKPYDMKAWDACMASSAALLAYPPHITEAGTITIDKATLHTPNFSVINTYQHKPDGTDVVSITLGTGHHDTDDISDDELFKFYMDHSEIGNTHLFEEAKAYNRSSSDMALDCLIGAENRFVISPRLSCHTEEEYMAAPSQDISDASPENIAKIKHLYAKLIESEEKTINHICQMLADNLYLIGRMDKEKFDRVTARLGVKNEQGMKPPCSFEPKPV